MPSVSNDEVNMKSYCSRDPRRLPKFARNKIIRLKEIVPKAAVLSSVNILGSGTDTADEDETTCISELRGSLFESRTINFNSRELESHSENVFLPYEKSFTQKHFDNLSKITKDQSLSRSWKAQRVGRITSSIAKTAFLADQYSPSKPFIANTMQFNPPFRSEATDYGSNMEKYAGESFQTFFITFHRNCQVKETGLHVNLASTFLRASPDGLVTCECHQPAVLEIKCPIKHRKSPKNWSTNQDFFIDPNRGK